MKQLTVNTKYIGLALIALGIALTAITYGISESMLKIADSTHGGSCESFETCPHVSVLTQTYPVYFVSFAVLAIGIFLAVFGGPPEKQGDRKKKWEEAMGGLGPDEKAVFGKLIEAGGVMFQSELVEQTGFPKAKVSRVLDRMEAGGLLERKRRGMTNAVILK